MFETTLNDRAVYWHESGDTMHIMIQGLRFNIFRYYKQYIAIFLNI